MSLNSNSANGIDDISMPIARFINEAMNVGTFPSELKIGNIIPIHKKGNKENCNNYRPITNLSAIYKIFEEVILKRLKIFIRDNNVIHKNQYGFVENSNTISAVLNCVEKIYANMNKKKYVAVLSIHLEKAFDSVNLRNLLYKLSELGLNETQMKLFECFLLDRKQICNNSERREKHSGNH